MVTLKREFLQGFTVGWYAFWSPLAAIGKAALQLAHAPQHTPRVHLN